MRMVASNVNFRYRIVSLLWYRTIRIHSYHNDGGSVVTQYRPGEFVQSRQQHSDHVSSCLTECFVSPLLRGKTYVQFNTRLVWVKISEGSKKSHGIKYTVSKQLVWSEPPKNVYLVNEQECIIIMNQSIIMIQSKNDTRLSLLHNKLIQL